MMPSTRSEPTPNEAGDQAPNKPVLDLKDNAGKIGAIDTLLGVESEGTAKPEKVEPAETEQSISEALAEGESPKPGGESHKPVKTPKTLQELSELTGLKVEDLYGIEIEAAEDGGESHTLGSLKDHAAKQIDYAGRELELQERRVKLENDQVKSRRDLEIILKALPPDSIKPEVMAQAKKEREVYLDREAARVLDVIPEWSDDENKRTDLAGISEHMAQYGFDETHVAQVADHRMLRYMRDNFNRKQLVDKALAKVKPTKLVPKGKKSQPAKSKTPVSATPESKLNEQLSAIDTLIK